MTFQIELGFANELADIADEISMRHFRDAQLATRTKTDGTPVTQADELIERELRRAIAERYPDDGIFGEEEGDMSSGESRRWILDPIDGTKNFSWGIANWGTLIALEVGGEIVVGVASAPALRERFAAARGRGATRNGMPIAVSGITDLRSARIGYTSAHSFATAGYAEAFAGLLDATADDRGFGDFYGHMLVAAGSLDLMVETALNPWDLGPLMVIVEEAGGRLTDLDGERTIYGRGAVTTNGHLHEAVLGAFRR